MAHRPPPLFFARESIPDKLNATMASSPLDRLISMRNEAITRLWEEKYSTVTRITVGAATCEHAAGSKAVWELLQNIKVGGGLSDCHIGHVGCVGRCDMEPMVEVVRARELPVKYVLVTPEKMRRIIEEHVYGGDVIEEWALRE